MTSNNVWQVGSSVSGLDGDLIFWKNANGDVFDMSIGHNYGDRGIRNGHHDALGVKLKLPLVKPEVRPAASATQPSKARSAKRIRSPV